MSCEARKLDQALFRPQKSGSFCGSLKMLIQARVSEIELTYEIAKNGRQPRVELSSRAVLDCIERTGDT